MPAMLQRLLQPQKETFFLFGCRGTGKSTWIRQHYESAIRYDLLSNRERLRLSKDPSLIASELAHLPPKSWVVIDEIQKVPELLDEVHKLIEEKRLRFILSGSSARKLRRGGANLLAGRARIENLFPLVSDELGDAFNLTRSLSYGGLPESVFSEEPKEFLRAYSEMYLEEEIKAEAFTRNLGGFARFLEIASRQNGQVTNTANVARDAQVARQTVQGYFGLLIDTLIGHWLPAWKLKRATKQIAHPKFYFFDPGVCRALSGRLPYPPTAEETGALFETLILHELRAYLSYNHLHYPIHFWSSRDNVEVDVLIETATGFRAIELKSGTRWDRSFNKGLHRLQEEMKLTSRELLGVYQGEREMMVDGIRVVPVAAFLSELWGGNWISK